MKAQKKPAGKAGSWVEKQTIYVTIDASTPPRGKRTATNAMPAHEHMPRIVGGNGRSWNEQVPDLRSQVKSVSAGWNRKSGRGGSCSIDFGALFAHIPV
jgi:hypothetical protein